MAFKVLNMYAYEKKTKLIKCKMCQLNVQIDYENKNMSINDKCNIYCILYSIYTCM